MNCHCSPSTSTSTSASASSPRLAIPSNLIFSPSNTSAVQWAWYAVTALGKGDEDKDEDDSDIDGLKSIIRTTLGRSGACDLLFVTLSKYGTVSSYPPPSPSSSSSSISAGCADVIQWSLSAMTVLAKEDSNLLSMLCTTATLCASSNRSSTFDDDNPPLSLPPPSSLTQINMKEQDGRNNKNIMINEKSKGNYSFFSRSMNINNVTVSLSVEEEIKNPSVRVSILMKAMNSNLNNSDIAEEFCETINALIMTPSDQKLINSSTATSTATLTSTSSATLTSSLTTIPVQSNRHLLISAGINELLIKILLAHENNGLVMNGSETEDGITTCPILENAFLAISQVREERSY